LEQGQKVKGTLEFQKAAGLGTVTGAAVGAFLYEELRGVLLTTEAFSHFQLVIAGLLLLGIVLFARGGLMGFIYGRWPRVQRLLP
jgi:ABC-type branched-subunit amino acid transport system permease subunit